MIRVGNFPVHSWERSGGQGLHRFRGRLSSSTPFLECIWIDDLSEATKQRVIENSCPSRCVSRSHRIIEWKKGDEEEEEEEVEEEEDAI